MAWQDDIQTTLENLCSLRAEISRNPKPSFDVHGHKYSWTEYLEYLGDEIDRCRMQLAQCQPFEEIGQGF